jgi:HSP20 family protein
MEDEMTIRRWNPFREMVAMQSALDRMLDEGWRSTGTTFTRSTLSLDAYETSDHYTVIAALPGLSEDSIDIRLENGVLSISAELPELDVPEDGRPLLQERVTGNISRSVTLPQHVDIDQVQAVYQNGILTLTLPKAPEAKPKQIPVTTSATVVK